MAQGVESIIFEIKSAKWQQNILNLMNIFITIHTQQQIVVDQF